MAEGFAPIAHASARRSRPSLGAVVGFMNWLGFLAFLQLGVVTYEKKPFSLFLINTGYQLVTLVVMGAILSRWGLAWA